MSRGRWFVGVLTLCLAAGSAIGQGTAADYERARALSGITRNKVFKADVRPHWLTDNRRFWYRNDLPGGAREYVLVDTERGVREPAFDHNRVAAGLSKAAGAQQDPTRLDIDLVDITAANLRFRAVKKTWKCDLTKYSLTEDKEEVKTAATDSAPARSPRRRRTRPSEVSPDGKWSVAIKDHNLFLRERAGGKEFALSSDGKPDDGYSSEIYWSPDGMKLVALRSKKGEEHKVYLIESSPRDQLQPKLHSLDYLKPGDRIPISKPHLFDVVGRKEIPVRDELFLNPYVIEDVRWSPDSRRFTFLYNQRGHQILRIVAVDAASGAARAVIDEQSKTFIDYAHKCFTHYLDESNEILWTSERDGWNHIYRYDSESAKVKNAVTHGPWVVRGVDRVDEKTRQVWFRASDIRPGQDPYFVHHCRVNVDGTGLVVLTEGNGNHAVQWSPDGRFFIDTWSRVDQAPVTELRRADDGKLVCELERADIHGLVETGWRAPEPFATKGRDGSTDIYGVIYRPTTFDPRKKYPIIEAIYAGPQGSFVPKQFRPHFAPQTMAELGFIVVQIDGMGTSNRSKAFHDVCWKNIGDAGFPDRIGWLRAAAAKYPYMDLSRVGIYGGSAGGQNALGGLLNHADFYKVAVADCGCHDNRMDKIWWNELWMGWPVGPHYAEQSNVTNAHKLQGKLLLMVGELDRNVDPASTMQVVSALINAGKDFDLLVTPGAGHGGGGAYAERRRQDFFVRNLLGVEPPDRNAIHGSLATQPQDTAIKAAGFEASPKRPKP
jgi:dipeptidyl aminopeptidase/acylaminoacyl peptidase